MSENRFSFDAYRDELSIGKRIVPTMDIGEWFAPLNLVGDGSLTSLKNAFKDCLTYYNQTESRPGNSSDGFSPTPLHIYLGDPFEFNENHSPFSGISIKLNGDGLEVGISCSIDASGLTQEDMETLLRGVIRSARASFIGASVFTLNERSIAHIAISLYTRGQSIRQAVKLGENVQILLEKIRNRDLSAESALDLVQANRSDLLIGMEESSWLEVKSAPYDLSEDAGRIELAQDVARFANGTESGLLLIGFTTKKRAGTEKIISVYPSLNRYHVSRYAKAIDAKVFPPLQGLKVVDIPMEMPDGNPGHLLAILVPRQPEESKPVLVYGAILDNKVEGAFISIIQRRGEDSIPTRPEAIHATLAAGRALLRHGEIPKKPRRGTNTNQ